MSKSRSALCSRKRPHKWDEFQAEYKRDDLIYQSTSLIAFPDRKDPKNTKNNRDPRSKSRDRLNIRR